MHRTACTARPATSPTRTRSSRGSPPRVAAGRITRISSPRLIMNRVNRRSLHHVLALCLAVSQLSCAVGGQLVPEQHSMPLARASLAPEYRIFYDTLVDYGDWVLIEP